ncbi:MAG: GTP cyclohydrolase I FolE2 [Candidatus Tectomicrobia bacterium]|uniref:GTP cyclohydrolase FolE2 n=1 Tax=Tectimicrobiota bacterium TaxID=2528274 RepID=A0A932HYB8_UNCTE|nr:GTP cyclohydrolase I FolE2 [Candidatus Tectomicrobia bacterium]
MPEIPLESAELADVQGGSDFRNVKIDKVGVKDIRYPIVVRDRAKKSQHTVGTINMYVDLPHQFKGTHMSRFLEVLNEHRGVVGVEHVRGILAAILQRLDARTAHFEVSFPYFMERDAPVTGASGMMAYECGFDASAGAVDDFVLSVKVNVATLCPCSKEISTRGAHNQRGNIHVKVRFEGELWIEELVEIAEESGSCALYPILKREDEKFVTEKAFDNPRFVEDVVRETAIRLRRDPRIRWFQVHVENFESIHDHNAYAFVEEWRKPPKMG